MKSKFIMKFVCNLNGDSLIPFGCKHKAATSNRFDEINFPQTYQDWFASSAHQRTFFCKRNSHLMQTFLAFPQNCERILIFNPFYGIKLLLFQKFSVFRFDFLVIFNEDCNCM